MLARHGVDLDVAAVDETGLDGRPPWHANLEVGILGAEVHTYRDDVVVLLDREADRRALNAAQPVGTRRLALIGVTDRRVSDNDDLLTVVTFHADVAGEQCDLES